LALSARLLLLRPDCKVACEDRLDKPDSVGLFLTEANFQTAGVMVMTRPWERHPWANVYRIALLEVNPDQMPARIRVAKSVIRTRVAEVGKSQRHEPELKALEDALKVLRILEEYQHDRKTTWARSQN
jgi:hypothetical protein